MCYNRAHVFRCTVFTRDYIRDLQISFLVRMIHNFSKQQWLLLISVKKLQVRASAVFVPEDSSVYGDPCKYVYYYFIRVSLPDACIVDGKCYSSSQFQSCSLIIRTGNDVFHDDTEVS